MPLYDQRRTRLQRIEELRSGKTVRSAALIAVQMPDAPLLDDIPLSAGASKRKRPALDAYEDDDDEDDEDDLDAALLDWRAKKI